MRAIPNHTATDTPAQLLACLIGGASIAAAGLSGFAWHIGDDGVALFTAALALGGVVVATAIRP